MREISFINICVYDGEDRQHSRHLRRWPHILLILHPCPWHNLPPSHYTVLEGKMIGRLPVIPLLICRSPRSSFWGCRESFDNCRGPFPFITSCLIRRNLPKLAPIIYSSAIKQSSQAKYPWAENVVLISIISTPMIPPRFMRRPPAEAKYLCDRIEMPIRRSMQRLSSPHPSPNARLGGAASSVCLRRRRMHGHEAERHRLEARKDEAWI